MWRVTPPEPVREQQWRSAAHVQHHITPFPCCSFTDALSRYYIHCLPTLTKEQGKYAAARLPLPEWLLWQHELPPFNCVSLHRDGNISQDAIPAAAMWFMHLFVCLFACLFGGGGSFKDWDWRLIWDETCLKCVKCKTAPTKRSSFKWCMWTVLPLRQTH